MKWLLVLAFLILIMFWFLKDVRFFSSYEDYYHSEVAFVVEKIDVDHDMQCFQDREKAWFCLPRGQRLQCIIQDSLFKKPNNDTIWIYHKLKEAEKFEVFKAPNK
jgi:hypothetical protein